MSLEAEPVKTYPDGRKYYFGTPENPFNFFPNVAFPQRSLEIEEAIANGAVLKLHVAGGPPPSADVRQHRIETYNRGLATSRLLGKLPLELSDLPQPSEDRPAA
jgi:hypothetical protein